MRLSAASQLLESPSPLLVLCQTQGPRTESGPPRHFMWPSTTEHVNGGVKIKVYTNVNIRMASSLHLFTTQTSSTSSVIVTSHIERMLGKIWKIYGLKVNVGVIHLKSSQQHRSIQSVNTP